MKRGSLTVMKGVSSDVRGLQLKRLKASILHISRLAVKINPDHYRFYKNLSIFIGSSRLSLLSSSDATLSCAVTSPDVHGQLAQVAYCSQSLTAKIPLLTKVTMVEFYTTVFLKNIPQFLIPKENKIMHHSETG